MERKRIFYVTRLAKRFAVRDYTGDYESSWKDMTAEDAVDLCEKAEDNYWTRLNWEEHEESARELALGFAEDYMLEVLEEREEWKKAVDTDGYT